MTPAEVEAAARRLGLRLYRACVKDNVNVSEIFDYLATKVRAHWRRGWDVRALPGCLSCLLQYILGGGDTSGIGAVAAIGDYSADQSAARALARGAAEAAAEAEAAALAEEEGGEDDEPPPAPAHQQQPAPALAAQPSRAAPQQAAVAAPAPQAAPVAAPSRLPVAPSPSAPVTAAGYGGGAVAGAAGSGGPTAPALAPAAPAPAAAPPAPNARDKMIASSTTPTIKLGADTRPPKKKKGAFSAC